MPKDKQPKDKPERETERGVRREQAEPEETAEAPPNPNLHTPFAASGEQHHCGIDHWLQAHPAAESEAKLEDKPEGPREELIEEIEPEPEPPHRRHKIWDRF